MTGVETVNHQEEEKNKIDYVDNYFDQPIDKKTEKAVKALEGIQQQAQATIDEIKDGEKSNETTENPVMEAWNKAKNEAFGIEEKINNSDLKENEELKYAFTPEERVKNIGAENAPESAKQVKLENNDKFQS